MLKKRLAALFAVLLALSLTTVSAGSNTTYTYTISVDGEWIRTQDAYMPGNIYLRNKGLSLPSDLFLWKEELYIADTGNKRIFIYNPESDTQRIIENEALQEPSGLFVDKDGTIFVADPKAEALFLFAQDGTLLKTIGRPDSYLFSKASEYKPKSVAVSSQGNIFVVGTGAHEGLMQFDRDGEFQGYFAANKRALSLTERIQDMFLSETQKESLSLRLPRPIESIDISPRDLISSVTQSGEVSYAWSEAEAKTENLVKLYNMAGENILSRNKLMNDEWNFVDVACDAYGNLFAVSLTGLIYEYNSSGEVIFSFGGRALTEERSGMLSQAAAIDISEDGMLYVLDKERALVQLLYPTEFAVATHRAIYELDRGNYAESEESWQALLRMNGMSKIAHLGYGKLQFLQQEYGEALEHFRIANDKEQYSDAFWELRDQWFHSYMPYLLAGAALAAVLLWIRGRYKRRRAALLLTEKPPSAPPPERGWRRLVREAVYAKSMLSHPIDGYYYLKKNVHGSVPAAFVLYILAFVVFACDLLLRGFIFNANSLQSLEPSMVVIMFVVPAVLWVVGNYWVSSINEGEGSFRNVLISTAYALTPYVVITPFVIVLSYILTRNEGFIISFLWLTGVIWSGVLLFVGVKETQNYSARETVKNIFLTLFFMVMVVVAFCILYLIWNKLIIFVGEWLGEVEYIAQS